MSLFLAQTLHKAELHAHLSGCVREATLEEWGENGAHSVEEGARTLSECFNIFARVHRAVVSCDRLSRVTREALEDVAADGVTYIELRTTPRELGDVQQLLQEHGRGLLLPAGCFTAGCPPAGEAARRFTSASPPASPLPWSAELSAYVSLVTEAALLVCSDRAITVRLLLSLNRTSDLLQLAATVDLAIAWSAVRWHSRNGEERLCVGLDVSGDPSKGSLEPLWPLLDRARAAGLRVTIHSGEVMRPEEVAAVLAWRPDRLGHMCVLSDVVFAQLVVQARDGAPCIPIELCPTSNAFTLGLPNPATDGVVVVGEGAHTLHAHPTLLPLLRAGYPLAVCTDDSGVFATTLSRELAAVADAAGWRVKGGDGSGARALASLALAGFAHAFLGEEPHVRAALVADAQRAADEALA